MQQKSCLYTSQKLKKKKLWHEGVLNIYAKDNKCVLYASNDNCIRIGTALETRFLTGHEMTNLLTGKSSELECDGHLIQVEEEIIKANEQKFAAVLNKPLAKFKPPAKITPKLPATHTSYSNQNSTNNNYMNNIMNMNNGRGYSVDDDELDELWGTSSSSRSDNVNGDRNVNGNYGNNLNINTSHNQIQGQHLPGEYQRQPPQIQTQNQNQTKTSNPYQQSYQSQSQVKSQPQSHIPNPTSISTSTSISAEGKTLGRKRGSNFSCIYSSGQITTSRFGHGENTGNKVPKVEQDSGVIARERNAHGHINPYSSYSNENARNNTHSSSSGSSGNSSSSYYHNNYRNDSLSATKTTATDREGLNVISLYSDPYAAAKSAATTNGMAETNGAKAKDDDDIWSD